MIPIYAWRLVTRNLRRTSTYLFGLALAEGMAPPASSSSSMPRRAR
jgi:hypothetical protein